MLNRRGPGLALALLLALAGLHSPRAVAAPAALAATAATATTAAVSTLPPAAAPRPAVVSEGTVDLFARPDATSPVEDQAILGDRIEALEESAGFTRIRSRGGQAGWVFAHSILRDPPPPAGTPWEVVSARAHLYRDPSFTTARPLLAAPLGARLDVVGTLTREGHGWAEVRLPDGRRAFAATDDLAPEPKERRPVLDPASWLSMARRFAGAPYTWGGTTPAGFDCSGLAWRVLERHGIVLLRNSTELCWREPRLVAVPFDRLQPGDLVFFGTPDRIDHMGFWVGDGTVLQATAYGTPSTKSVPWDDARMKPRFRAARRLAELPGAPKPPSLTDAKRSELEKALRALATDGTARYGIVFEEVATGARVALGERVSMHAASTMKTPVMLEVLRRVDEGTLQWDMPVLVKKEFRSLVDGSPFTCEPEEGADSDVVPLLGKNAPLSLLVRAMITRSSNIATNLVLEVVGAEKVQALDDRLGAPTVKVRRMVSDLKAFDAGISNETDAAGMAAVMKAVVRSPLLSAASRERAFSILADQHWNEEIPAGIPREAGVVVAHKTGSISTVQHDAAILRLPDGREYVLVLLADGFKGDEARAKVFETTRRMARACWEAAVAP